MISEFLIFFISGTTRELLRENEVRYGKKRYFEGVKNLYS